MVAHWGPLSVGFCREEYWSQLLCPPPGDLSDPGIEPTSLTFPVLASRFSFFFFTTSITWEAMLKSKSIYEEDGSQGTHILPLVFQKRTVLSELIKVNSSGDVIKGG